MPKVGAPVCIEIELANEPKITGAPGLTACVKAMPLIASANVCANVPATETGDIAPAKMNGDRATAWLLRAYTFSAPSIVSSHVIGEFALISEVAIVLFCTNSSPNRIFAISTVSCARDGAVTDPINGLSEKRIWA